MESYSVITKTNILPPLTGPVLAVIIISGAFGYSFVTRSRAVPIPLEDDPKEKTK